MINVKSRRAIAVSMQGERSDSSVNQGGKTSNLYVFMHTFKLFVVFLCSEEGAIF